jgi:hypothetical protein
MPWTPAYNLVSIECLATNLLAIFRRDQAAALAWASPSVALQPFMYFGIARRVDQQIFPACLALYTGNAPMEQSADEAAVQMHPRFMIEISNVNSDPDRLTREILTRSRAVTAMVLSASPMDIFEGVTLGAFGGLSWDIQEIGMPDVQFTRQNAQGQYMVRSQLIAVFNYIET